MRSCGHCRGVENGPRRCRRFFDIDALRLVYEHKTLSSLTEKLDNKLPTYNAFVAHPAYTDCGRAYWLFQGNKRSDIIVGVLTRKICIGAFTTSNFQKYDKQNKVFFVMGPWNHGGWNGPGRKLGAIDFGSDTGKYFREEIQAPFFACQLKLKCYKPTPEASIFESGSNKWMNYDSWPPKQGKPRELYLQTNGKLSFEKPAAAKTDEGFDSYVSDHANPVPYRKRPIQAPGQRLRRWRGWSRTSVSSMTARTFCVSRPTADRRHDDRR